MEAVGESRENCRSRQGESLCLENLPSFCCRLTTATDSKVLIIKAGLIAKIDHYVADPSLTFTFIQTNISEDPK